MSYNDEEFLDFFNRLLERLHQADLNNHGSKIEVVYVAPGGQHVDKVERQYISPSPVRASPPDPSPVQEGSSLTERRARKGKEGYRERREEMPDALRTEAAMVLWEKVREAGYVDEDYQPRLSRSQAALLADTMAEQLGIKEKWKVFETLWQRKNMYRDYYKALNLQQSLTFQDKIKRLFR